MFLVHNKPQQAPLLAAAIVGACRLEGGWPTPLQPQLLEVLFEGLLGYKADFHTLAPVSAEAVAAALTSPQQRHELVELMVLMELLCRPIPAPLRESVERCPGPRHGRLLSAQLDWRRRPSGRPPFPRTARPLRHGRLRPHGRSQPRHHRPLAGPGPLSRGQPRPGAAWLLSGSELLPARCGRRWQRGPGPSRLDPCDHGVRHHPPW